jgi:hypothetical protein
MSKKKELTLKQKKAIKLLFDNLRMPIGEAMRQAGYAENTCLHPQNLTESDAFKEAFTKAGVTDEAAAKVLSDSFVATKVVGYLNKVNKSQEAKPDESVSNDFLEVPDHPTRLKGAELYYKSTKRFSDSAVVNLQGNRIIVEMDGK